MVGISFCAWILENVVLSSTAKRQNHLTYKKSRNYETFFVRQNEQRIIYLTCLLRVAHNQGIIYNYMIHTQTWVL